MNSNPDSVHDNIPVRDNVPVRDNFPVHDNVPVMGLGQEEQYLLYISTD